MFVDKRRAFRRVVEWSVKIELNGKGFETSCINISEGGIRIEGIKNDLHLTSMIIEHLHGVDKENASPELAVKIPAGIIPINLTLHEIVLKGKVKWFHTDNVSKKHYVGIAFMNQPDIRIFSDGPEEKSGITLFPEQ